MTNAEDRAWRDYSQRFRAEVLSKLLNTAVVLSLHSDDPDFDVRQATEVGAALLLDKPILLIVPRGRTPGARLRRAADVVVDDFDVSDSGSQERLADAIRSLRL